MAEKTALIHLIRVVLSRAGQGGIGMEWQDLEPAAFGIDEGQEPSLISFGVGVALQKRISAGD